MVIINKFKWRHSKVTTRLTSTKVKAGHQCQANSGSSERQSRKERDQEVHRTTRWEIASAHRPQVGSQWGQAQALENKTTSEWLKRSTQVTEERSRCSKIKPSRKPTYVTSPELGTSKQWRPRGSLQLNACSALMTSRRSRIDRSTVSDAQRRYVKSAVTSVDNCHRLIPKLIESVTCVMLNWTTNCSNSNMQKFWTFRKTRLKT